MSTLKDLPTERIRFSVFEGSLLRVGLDLLANRLATAKLGSFPFGQPWERLEPNRPPAYVGRKFDSDMAQCIIGFRAKLWDLASTRRLSLNVVELAAAAFALRLYPITTNSSEEITSRSRLANKLETCRKRAKRSTQRVQGRSGYNEVSKTWQGFVSWCRYYLLSPKPVGTSYLSRRQIWAEQRGALKRKIVSILAERCYGGVTDAELTRVAKLLKEEFRRGRHPVILTEMLRSTSEGDKDLLFRLVSKKVPLVPLPGAKLDNCQMASERAERLKLYERRGMVLGTYSSSPAATGGHASNETQGPKVSSDLPGPRSHWLPRNFESLANDVLFETVADWFQHQVEPNDALDVANLAVNHALQNPGLELRLPTTYGLEGLIDQTRPIPLRGYVPDRGRRIRLQAVWLLHWMLICRPYPEHTANVLATACSRYRALNADLSRMQVQDAP